MHLKDVLSLLNAGKDLSLSEFVSGMTKNSLKIVKTSDKGMPHESGSDFK